MRDIGARRVCSAETSSFGLWLSLVERCVRDAEAVGSNPTSPTPAILLCFANEPSGPHNHRAHRIRGRFLSCGHSDPLAAVRPDRAGPGLECVQNHCGHRVGWHRSRARHGRARSGDYLVRRRSERENWSLVSSDRRRGPLIVRPLLFVPSGYGKGTRSFPLSP